MFKKAIFGALFVCLCGAAYAQVPTATLTIQVVPAAAPNPCSIAGQAGNDAGQAGFSVTALCNDFTTLIPNAVGTGLPEGWLNCNGSTIDTGAVWNVNNTSQVPCPTAYQQVTDAGGGGNRALDIDFKSSYELSGGSWPGNIAQLITVPLVNNDTNSNPAHSFSNAYYEITYRMVGVPGQFTGGMESFWQFTCCNTGSTFVDNEIFEDWSYWGQAEDFGWNWWNPALQNGAFDRSIPNRDPTTYHTIGGMVTSNSTNFSQCMYFDGSRVKCDQGAYHPGQSGAQRRNLIIWNGTACSFSPTNNSCVGSFTDIHMYIKSVKVVTCSAEVAGGSCIGTNFNGNFYTP